MKRNWAVGTREEELKKRIIDLRLIYDWPALKSAVSICPGSTTDKFRLNDLFNLLDMHIPPGFGLRAHQPSRPDNEELSPSTILRLPTTCRSEECAPCNSHRAVLHRLLGMHRLEQEGTESVLRIREGSRIADAEARNQPCR